MGKAKIVLAGFGQPIIDLYQWLASDFDILGIIVDYHRRAKFPNFYEFLESNQLSILDFESAQKLQAQAIVVYNYNKIISVANIQVPYLLNIHMGLLPIYRGNNANSWAILNGDYTVGYTLHEVNEKLDQGDIYYKFGYTIQANETYFHAKQAMKADMQQNLSAQIVQILQGKVTAQSQKDASFLYACPLVPQDGIITDWNQPTQDFIRRYMVFARPLGTGLQLEYNNTLYEINQLSEVPGFLSSKGIPGAVVLLTSEGAAWIKTADTAIAIESLTQDGNVILPSALFKIGQRL
ncbi:hypothetical protein G4D82_04440 [Flavobacterium sp. CYK-4]|uniref:formyltransferase family protein n=1 Tax=Flavobacterium lotistagni TaxID=2709660 RepID=UPI0014080940|nr:formyltransferase family protein [Flavobacterium lotistagni]NHM06459.1 hypothetical protein [Flavobacterium lotistagni]